MALARSIRRSVQGNMQKLRAKKKKKSSAINRCAEEIGADLVDAGGGGGVGEISSGSTSSGSGDSVVNCSKRRRRNRFSSGSSIGSGSKNGSTSFVVTVSRAKRFVSPQGLKAPMGWMRKLSGPFRRAWDIVSCRHIQQSRKRARGMGRLYDDVRSCGYDDVHLMWSMLQTHNVETSRWRRLSRRQFRGQRSEMRTIS